MLLEIVVALQFVLILVLGLQVREVTKAVQTLIDKEKHA
jgi:hypothetical protein